MCLNKCSVWLLVRTMFCFSWTLRCIRTSTLSVYCQVLRLKDFHVIFFKQFFFGEENACFVKFSCCQSTHFSQFPNSILERELDTEIRISSPTQRKRTGFCTPLNREKNITNSGFLQVFFNINDLPAAFVSLLENQASIVAGIGSNLNTTRQWRLHTSLQLYIM